jgi:hypothetical protein
MSYTPSREANKETRKKRSKQGAKINPLSLSSISPAIFQHTAIKTGCALFSNATFFPHIG